MATIAIIGAGAIGRALGGVLTGGKHRILFWDVDASKAPHQGTIQDAVRVADFIFLCIPSKAVRSAVQDMRRVIRPGAVMVALAKGVEASSGMTMDRLLEDALPRGIAYALFGGPMLAAEISSGMPTTGVLGGDDARACRRVAELFTETSLHVVCSDDRHGVALAGTLKNIYAVALGIAQALGWGDNQKGWLVASALREMGEIAERLGGRRETVYGFAGLGDLVATGFSPHSRNRRVGEAMVMGETISGESTNALPAIVKRIGGARETFPILAALGEIMINKKDARETFGRLL